MLLEEQMTRYFSSLNLTCGVVEYFCDGEYDWLLTERVPGEDCTYDMFLSEPKKLCDILAEQLRSLHDTDFSCCPVNERMDVYLKTVEDNYNNGKYDFSYLIDRDQFRDIKEVWNFITNNKKELCSDTLIHGDYCLPNIILNDWKFSGFIDVGNGGVADRHIDLYWGAWSLNFNLKTDKYRERFFDAYGRDKVDVEKIKLISACEIFG